MTYEEIVGKAVVVFAKADASEIDGHLAVQINVTGEGHGIFYIEVTDGKVDVQPYEYYDRDAILIIDSKSLLKILTGKIDFNEAYNDDLLEIKGDLGAALMLTTIKLKPHKK